MTGGVGFRMPRVSVKGVGLYYEEAGDGFPLVLLHPWPTDHAMWLFQVPVFSEAYRVITPDIKGLGKSDKPEGEGTLPLILRMTSRDSWTL